MTGEEFHIACDVANDRVELEARYWGKLMATVADAGFSRRKNGRHKAEEFVPMLARAQTPEQIAANINAALGGHPDAG